jgi:hypothetical protein
MKLILKIASLVFVFAIPTAIFIYYFQGEPQTVVKSTFGFVPTIMVGIVGFISIRLVFTIVKTKIEQDRTGTTAITFYSVVLLVLFLASWSLLSQILTTATNNYDTFVSTYTLYINVVKASSASIAIGLILNGFEHWLRFRT